MTLRTETRNLLAAVGSFEFPATAAEITAKAGLVQSSSVAKRLLRLHTEDYVRYESRRTTPLSQSRSNLSSVDYFWLTPKGKSAIAAREAKDRAPYPRREAISLSRIPTSVFDLGRIASMRI